MATSTELGIPYLWPCASHHNANLPSLTARSKSATSRLSWSSASEIARVTTRRGNATFVASAHTVHRACDQSVFACATWADDQHETSRANEIYWSCRRRGQSHHARRFPPHQTHSSCITGLMDMNEIGAFAGCDFTAICQPDNVRWCLAHHANGPGKIILFDFLGWTQGRCCRDRDCADQL